MEQITIIHQFCIDEENFVGGIDSWIQDFLILQKRPTLVFGTYSKEKTRIIGNSMLYGIQKKTRRKRIPASLKFSLALIWQARKFTNHIYIHRIEYAVILKMLKPRSKITLFIHTDASAMLGNSSDSFWRFFPNLYLKLEELSLKFPSKVCLYSASDFERIQKIRVDAIQLKSFYNDDIFTTERNWSERDEIVLWVGRFEKPKDPIFALKVAEEFLRHEVTHIRFLFLGTGSLEREMLDFKDQACLSNTEIWPAVDRQRLATIMNQSKVLFLTSDFEGSPRILYEALGTNLYIVTCKTSDPDNLGQLPENGIQVISKDTLHFYNAIMRLLSIERIPIENHIRKGSEVLQNGLL